MRRLLRRLARANPTLDARGIVTHACPSCGGRLFRVLASFHDFELVFYTLDGECAGCGTRVTVPTPLDGPDPLAPYDDLGYDHGYETA